MFFSVAIFGDVLYDGRNDDGRGRARERVCVCVFSPFVSFRYICWWRERTCFECVYRRDKKK